VNQALTKSSLTPALSRLVELMQALNFGRVEALAVRGGQPLFDPSPRVIQKVKMGADNGPRPEVASADFRLKDGVIELLEIIARVGTGEIRSIEVRCGYQLVWRSSGARRCRLPRAEDEPRDTWRSGR
jgi:hypothetical protein